jgi:hypothetical protein
MFLLVLYQPNRSKCEEDKINLFLAEAKKSTYFFYYQYNHCAL